MSKNRKDPDWDYINNELDRYYAPYVTGGPSGSLVADGFTLKKGGRWETPSGAPLADASGNFYLFHKVGKHTGFPTLSAVAASGALIKNYSPRLYVKEFGCYSGMGKNANVAMYKEVFSPDVLEEQFGWKSVSSKAISKKNKIELNGLIKNDNNKASDAAGDNKQEFVPANNDVLLTVLKDRLEVDDVELHKRWSVANLLLNRYYLSAAYQYLSDNYLKGDNSDKNVEFFKPDGTGFVMSSEIMSGGHCITYSKTGEVYTPFTFMLNHGAFSGLNKASAIEDMFREAFNDEQYHSLLSSYKKAPKPTAEQLKESENSKKQKALRFDEAIKKVQYMFGKGESGDGGILQRRGISKELLTEDKRFNKKLVYCKESWSVGYLNKVGFDLGPKASKFKDTQKIKISYVAFKHFNSKGILVGGERFFRPDARGKNLKLFTAAPSQKLLWMSDDIENARAVFIVENVLDALSHAQLYPDKKDYGYIATCGRMGEHGMDYLKYQLKCISKGRDKPVPVILAFDNDEGKKDNAAKAMREYFIQELSDMYEPSETFDNKGAKGLIGVVMPYGGVNDWNDSLKAYIARVELNNQNSALLQSAAQATKEPNENDNKPANDLTVS